MTEDKKDPGLDSPGYSKPARVARQNPGVWRSQRFRELFPEIDAAAEIPVTESENARRVLDFFLGPSRVSARVHSEPMSRGGKAVSVELAIPELSDAEWERVMEELSRESYVLSRLLAGELPPEVEQAFKQAGTELFPPRDAMQIRCEEENSVGRARDIQVFLTKLGERLESDPFAIFVLRGRGRDEILLELRRRRREQKSYSEPTSTLSQKRYQFEAAPPLALQMNNFWSSGTKLSELTFTIKADELPAALLKRLDPIPLGALEEEVESALEEAYAKVATRAQGYGLGLGR